MIIYINIHMRPASTYCLITTHETYYADKIKRRHQHPRYSVRARLIQRRYNKHPYRLIADEKYLVHWHCKKL